MPYFSSNFNYNPYITTPVTPIGYLNPPQFILAENRRQNTTLQDDQVIPELHRENATLQPDHLPISNNVSTQTSQPPTSAHANLCGLTRLHIGDGCTSASIFSEDCNATGRYKAHLANHIDSYSHRLDGLPKRTFSACPNSPSSTTTERATPKRIPQNALSPWRHPNFPLAPTNTPVQEAYQDYVATNAANGADYA